MLNNKERLVGLNHGKGCIRYANPDKIEYDLLIDFSKLTAASDTRIC